MGLAAQQRPSTIAFVVQNGVYRQPSSDGVTEIIPYHCPAFTRRGTLGEGPCQRIEEGSVGGGGEGEPGGREGRNPVGVEGEGVERERERGTGLRQPSLLPPSESEVCRGPRRRSLGCRGRARRVCELSRRPEVLTGIEGERERREEGGEGEGGPCLDVAYRATKGGARSSPSLALHIALLARTPGPAPLARPRGPASPALGRRASWCRGREGAKFGVGGGTRSLRDKGVL